ncbi:hypothetical protein SAMN05443661_12532 [Natronobacterium gregoryi]|uniref:Uncharacterized protein n=2 Tax=Natronobacterium gregoryi TaxID=44930 RepID=L9YJV4_NATGS|nr:hypothetical protein C490_00845 [Natronobacterium gregoryi SP2]SFJ37842.1 hypothetical protein SAMN05443661_12532 [Natronobacterium gregoryi]
MSPGCSKSRQSGSNARAARPASRGDTDDRLEAEFPAAIDERADRVERALVPGVVGEDGVGTCRGDGFARDRAQAGVFAADGGLGDDGKVDGVSDQLQVG